MRESFTRRSIDFSPRVQAHRLKRVPAKNAPLTNESLPFCSDSRADAWLQESVPLNFEGFHNG